MHLKNPLLFGLMAILLLGGTITPGLSQSSFNSEIIINEVETNSTGSDISEFVELYNPTSTDIDVSGWSISPSATWKTLEIPAGTIIEANSFLAFTHVNFWFKDFGETVTLYDISGNLVDETPLLIDQNDDATSWQRTTDGYDTDSNSDWELKRMTPKSSNGKIIETQESSFSLSAEIEQTAYVFGDSVIVSGNISEKLFSPNSTPEIIKINVKGPNYFKNFALFPDRDLNFSTSLNVQKVLGFNEGTYDVTISYGDHTVNLNFEIASSLGNSDIENEIETLEIITDKESYIPGEFVTLFANTNSSIEYGGLDYTVTDPEGKIVFEGTIFPNESFSKVFQQGSGQLYPFSTKLFMGTVNPVYGTYEINGIFKSQNVRAYASEIITATSSFTLIEDIKENVPISISTDKEIYSVGDIIKITGRSNDIWVEDLELFVTQTGILSSTAFGSDARYIPPNPFELRDAVRLNGDGTFEFEFTLVESIDSTTDDYAKYYGDYKVTVSEYFGDGTVFFKVVDDPESFVDIRTPLGVKIDKSSYVLGSGLSLVGKILDYHQTEASNNLRNILEITFTDPTGRILMSEDRTTSTNDYGKSPNAPVKYTAFPDSVGGFKMDIVLHPIQFHYGTYTLKVAHPLSGTTESAKFEIKSAQSEILPETETQEPITLKICKGDRAHTNEILKDLKSIGKGEILPSMNSVDCSSDQVFAVGDKLIVTGKVIPKNPTSLTSTYADRSSDSQTSDGHSYSTNYAQAMMNYVEVSIPYPKSMTVTNDSAWVTIPNEDENYTGGGGSGGGGSYYEDKDGNIIRGGAQYCESYREDCTDKVESERNTGYDGTAVLKKQKILLTDMNHKAYPDEEGNFATIFELRAGVFNQGVYSVKANYYGHYSEEEIQIIDNSLKGGLKPELVLNLEKNEFVPGETVRMNGIIKNIYYYDNVSLKIETPDVSKINCFEGHQCGFGNTEKKLRVQEGVEGPIFFWNYKIPDSLSSIGKYTVVVDTHFDELEVQFFVVDGSEIIGTSPSAQNQQSLITNKIIEKFNRISDSEIPITLGEKLSEESTLMPRVLQGSLFTSARGEESDVNLRISTTDGQCVIGQGSDCMVTESTRKPGAIYSIVSIDDVNYKIRYSGNDVRLEKFSIVPEESNSQINIDNWKVEVIKDEQPSRFYYKVSYIALE